MSRPAHRRPHTTLAALVLPVCALAACGVEDAPSQDTSAPTGTADTPSVDGAGDVQDDSGGGPSCTIGTVKDGVFSAWVDGDDAELVVGYQGYLFVYVQVADSSGALLKPKARMTAKCVGLEPSITSRWRADMTEQEDGSTVSEQLEVWLFPALRTEFEGQLGTLEVELEQDGLGCHASVNVRYVDDELCKHFEDGSLKCVK